MDSYFFIPLIVCIILTIFVFSFVSYPCSEPKGQKNKVRYFVTKDNRLQLWLGKPKWNENAALWDEYSRYVHFICNEYSFKYYKLTPHDFDDMKVGEIREVYLDLEDCCLDLED